jgi:outer membrane protein OmpA-like peptidoglycan-associated protein
MRQSVPITLVMMAALVGGGCATKKYVQKTVAPVGGKLDQVAQQTNQQGQTLDQTRQTLDQTKQTLDQTRKDLERTDTELSATKERAMSADTKAGQAMTKADQLSQKSDQMGHDLGDLKNTVANLDDYKQVGDAVVTFKFNSDKLSNEAKQQLDQLVANQSQYKRYFIAVEGYTDRTGSVEYNNDLSRRRADAAVQYLVAQHSIPIYRIHMVGLGKQKPVDEGHGRNANAKNRRVEVMMFSADQGAMAMNQSGAQGATPAARPAPATGNQPQ